MEHFDCEATGNGHFTV